MFAYSWPTSMLGFYHSIQSSSIAGTAGYRERDLYILEQKKAYRTVCAMLEYIYLTKYVYASYYYNNKLNERMHNIYDIIYNYYFSTYYYNYNIYYIALNIISVVTIISIFIIIIPKGATITIFSRCDIYYKNCDVSVIYIAAYVAYSFRAKQPNSLTDDDNNENKFERILIKNLLILLLILQNFIHIRLKKDDTLHTTSSKERLPGGLSRDDLLRELF